MNTAKKLKVLFICLNLLMDLEKIFIGSFDDIIFSLYYVLNVYLIGKEIYLTVLKKPFLLDIFIHFNITAWFNKKKYIVLDKKLIFLALGDFH